MDEIDFTHILDDGDRPEATPEVLGRIVARHRHRRARRYQVVASTAVVVALAGAGIGIGLQNASGHRPGGATASALSAPPAGLTWEASSTSRQAAATPSAFSVAAQPGVFGFGAATSGPVAPLANGDAVAGAAFAPEVCRTNGCTVYYQGNIPHSLFVRHVDGLTISALTEEYAYPASLRAVAPGKVSTAPVTGVKAPTNPPPAGALPASASSAKPLPAVIACPPTSELLVKVTGHGMDNTLYVPVGASTDHAFSVVASAVTTLPDGRTVVLAVARTSPSVASVSAAFPGAGSDAMAPVKGWAVLAQLLTAGSVPTKSDLIDMVAKSSSGQVLETARLPETGALATAPAVAVCHVLVAPNPVTAPSPGSSTGSGTTGSGTTGSGTVAGSSPAPPPAGSGSG